MNLKSLYGLTFEAAVAKIEAAGYTARLREENGEILPGTLDVQDHRVNLHIENGVVVFASIG